ncbi:MAG: type III-B CRISPR-associated protein Cas10/Cmr2 [Candidatus Sericytochromatia bacterium]|nr:type III-B CRISPR-associated protein Cas10/Cmr2 [Candidatus Sericytochromatia bacterium]
MIQTPEYFWVDLLREYLHDPPDKPLDIKGHASRGRRYAEIAAGRAFSSEEHGGAGAWADQRASEIERLPLPHHGGPERNFHLAIGPENNQLTVSHPLWSADASPSPSRRTLTLPQLDEKKFTDILSKLTKHIKQPQARFLAVWRCLPEKLSELNPTYQHLPAETRAPDHTIWQHLDTTAGLYAAYRDNEKLSFISLTIGPVQSFIAASRSVRDLWSGSMLLSWLAFQGMIPILEQVGPTAFVFPQLRGNPMMDLWLRDHFPDLQANIPLPNVSARKSPCLPNRFVAMVPASQAEDLANICKNAVNKAWCEVAHAVHQQISRELNALGKDWDRHWQQQIEGYFNVSSQVLNWMDYDDDVISKLYGEKDFETVFTEAGKLRELSQRIPKADRTHYSQESVGRWQARIDLLGRLLETQKQFKQTPNYFPQAPTPPKCSLLGTYEQMGPAQLSDSTQFWSAAAQNLQGWTRLRKNERFSAIALIKRFAPESFLLKALKLQKTDLSIPDTASIAASIWLQKHGLDTQQIRQQHDNWSGQWLHAQQPETSEESMPAEVWDKIRKARDKDKPPTYYSVLMMDGDNLGEWLQGKHSPQVQQAYHPKIVNYYRSIKADDLLKTRRPVTPAYHGAISEALANFALHVVPEIVQKYHGTLIYAGGDDVFALLPTQNALACAQDLNQAFRGLSADNPEMQGYYRTHSKDYLMMGPSATLSAGLAVVHYKEDLRHALELARTAEKHAKSQGRNGLSLTASRRSGETATIFAEWHELNWMQDWVNLFIPETGGQKRQAISNRWAYKLRETLQPLSMLSQIEPAQAEIRRQIKQMENPERLYEWFASHRQSLSEALQTAFNEAEQKHQESGHRLPMTSLTSQAMAEWFGNYNQTRVTRLSPKQSAHKAEQLLAKTLPEFVLMCQTLAFLARGREE